MASRTQEDSVFGESGKVAIDDLRWLDERDGMQDRGKILVTACMGFFTDAYDLSSSVWSW